MGIPPAWVQDALSLPRFAPYLARVGGDSTAAIDLYWWNVGVSAAFYAPLHCLEVTLRNSLHRQLSHGFNRSDWWQVASLSGNGPVMVLQACHKAKTRGRAGAPDDVVTELSFGFWVSCVSRVYDRNLWVPYLYRAFPHYHGRRSALHSELQTMLLFRNRIMHHEPIHHRHLAADHRTVLRLLGYMSRDMVQQLTAYDQVGLLLGQRPGCTSSNTPGV